MALEVFRTTYAAFSRRDGSFGAMCAVVGLNIPLLAVLSDVVFPGWLQSAPQTKLYTTGHYLTALVYFAPVLVPFVAFCYFAFLSSAGRAAQQRFDTRVSQLIDKRPNDWRSLALFPALISMCALFWIPNPNLALGVILCALAGCTWGLKSYFRRVGV